MFICEVKSTRFTKLNLWLFTISWGENTENKSRKEDVEIQFWERRKFLFRHEKERMKEPRSDSYQFYLDTLRKFNSQMRARKFRFPRRELLKKVFCWRLWGPIRSQSTKVQSSVLARSILWKIFNENEWEFSFVLQTLPWRVESHNKLLPFSRSISIVTTSKPQSLDNDETQLKILFPI